MEYPWAYDAWKYHESTLHWWFEEPPLADDVKDWNHKLTSNEKEFLTQLFRFFVTADIDVAAAYCDKYVAMFKAPEVRMMIMSFANRESTHIAAYDALLQTINMPDSEYKVFQEYKAMAAKHEYLTKESRYEGLTDKQRVALDLATFSAFAEGVQLFSSFIMLQSFAERGLMKGMGTMIKWSARDEDAHCQGMIKVYQTYAQENPEILQGKQGDRLKRAIYQTARDMIALEDNFIDLAFANFTFPNLEPDGVKESIRYLGDRRLLQLGLKSNFHVRSHKYTWFTENLMLPEHANFFEGKPTEYVKKGMVGDGSSIGENW
jgi:ribonucleoside-diphosphate reductase beta chain